MPTLQVNREPYPILYDRKACQIALKKYYFNIISMLQTLSFMKNKIM